MEFKINDNGSGFDQNIKNNIIEFVKLCYELNPVSKKIEIVLLNNNFDNTDLKSNDSKIYLITRNQNIHTIIKNISIDWMNIFSLSRNIKLAGIESELMVKKFYDKNPNLLKHG